jgi:hypothetical protein
LGKNLALRQEQINTILMGVHLTRTAAPVRTQQMRSSAFDFRAVEGNDNQIELSFSSEFPVKRLLGLEILLHEEGAVDFGRLLTAGTLLFSHGQDPQYGKMPIGKIEKAWLDMAQRKGKALITFDDDEDSQKVKKKVLNGSIRGVSFGYQVDSWEEVLPGKTSSNGRFTGPAYIALKWAPIEISIEPVPADPTVGVGRSEEELFGPMNAPRKSETVEDAVQDVRREISEIIRLCNDFNIDYTKYLNSYFNSGATFEQVRTAILDKFKAERANPKSLLLQTRLINLGPL